MQIGMHVESLSIGGPIRHRQTVVLAIIGLLLLGMWTFAVHNHHDESLGADTDCQICQLGAYGSAALPVVGFSPIPVLPEIVSGTFIEIAFIALPVRANEARAPPFISYLEHFLALV